MKAVNLILIISFLISTQLYAQKDKGKHKEMRKEMKAYKDANILPVLKTQRLKLERELTEAEKSTISRVRLEMEASKKANKSFRKEIKKIRKSGNELTEAHKEKMMEIRSEKKQAMQTLKPIAKAHKETLKALNEEIEPKKEVWKSDLHAIRSKHISDEEWEKMKEEKRLKRESHRAEKGDKKAKHGKKEGNDYGLHKMRKPTRFLLLNPDI